jgi:hypothetical protein
MMMRLASKRPSVARTLRPRRILLAMLLTLFSVGAARADTWYLMLADEKFMSEPEIATRMSRGSTVGPIHITSRAEFPSRDKCEAARPALIDDWRKRGIITRGSWKRHGFSAPDAFILCISDADPRLAKSSVKAEPGRSMDLFLNSRMQGRMP